MRKALNENKKVQAGIVGALALLVVAVFYMNMGGGGGGDAGTAPPPSAPPETADTSVPGAGDSATLTDPDLAIGAESEPIGPSLPKNLLADYRRGDTVALLVVGEGGIEDQEVRKAINRVKGQPGVSIYVVTDSNVARYARLTHGVGMSRVPALIVLRPRRVTQGPPEAQVHYGYLGPDQIRRAIADAAFDGAPGSYSPG